MKGPLDGVRILDLTIWGQSFGTAMLGDMGAEVIKLEDYPRGDPIRGAHENRTVFDIPDSPVSPNLQVTTRSKKSLAINLRAPGAAEIVYRLAKSSDVFATNLRHGFLDKVGLSYPALKAANERIIYVRNSGWGPKGPDKDRPGMDMAAQARGGLMSMMVDGEGGAPPPWGVHGLADTVGALQFAYSIATALFARERTGIGQEVNISLLGAEMTAGALMLQQYLLTDQEPARPSHTKIPNPLRNTFRTKDGRYIAFNLTQADRHWPAFCRVLGLEHLIDDPRFNDIMKRKYSEELVALFDQAFESKTKDEWVEVLRKTDLIFSPVQNYGEVARDPQMIENDYIATIEHPTVGPIKMLGIPVQFVSTPGKIQGPAPEWGEHTEQVLSGVGGYSWDEINDFKARGLIV